MFWIIALTLITIVYVPIHGFAFRFIGSLSILDDIEIRYRHKTFKKNFLIGLITIFPIFIGIFFALMFVAFLS